jgi:pantoate--beta-alanine ligase
VIPSPSLADTRVLEVIETITALRQSLSRRSPTGGGGLALVPTMGALHAGHAALIKHARAENDLVVVSIFVNPIQFNNRDDLARYPRTLDTDVTLCRDLGVDVVFAPTVPEIYPQPLECTVNVGRLADHLCGKFRPGHFQGVATVVLKLFEIVQPDRAYFGEKDAQQLAIIRRLAADFNLPLAIVEVPTVREADGLAMSSRNRLLSIEERSVATALYQALLAARRQVTNGARNADEIRAAAITRIPKDPALRLEYLDIVDPATMQPVEVVNGPVRVAGAMWVGNTRLIDNLLASPAMIRTATISDTRELARLINEAFIIEAFFKIGDRTSENELAGLINDGGEFLIADDGSGKMAGCAYLKCEGERAYFGMLSIDPQKQRLGLGRTLINAVEARARGRGCRFMDIHIVNLREELPPYYRGLGYEEQGTRPFPAPERASQPCHFIVMTKRLSD